MDSTAKPLHGQNSVHGRFLQVRPSRLNSTVSACTSARMYDSVRITEFGITSGEVAREIRIVGESALENAHGNCQRSHECAFKMRIRPIMDGFSLPFRPYILCLQLPLVMVCSGVARGGPCWC